MTPDELGMSLHDRATRGLPLSPEEERQLQDWYDEKDREEAAMLKRNAGTAQTVTQADVDAVLEQIAAATKRIQELTRENEALRQNVTALRSQLESRTSS
jgi:predicted RNase H-like nuclease (RuvC/YqgF family)